MKMHPNLADMFKKWVFTILFNIALALFVIRLQFLTNIFGFEADAGFICASGEVLT